MRARNLKPGFFKSDQVAACSFEARILFAGLWCMADREGRLEDRLSRIKAEIFPFDSLKLAEIDEKLAEIAENSLIIRYKLDGNSYIQITGFASHQNPHVKEKASVIPPPPRPVGRPRLAPDLHGASTVQTGLIPDSPFPHADSPFPLPSSAGGQAENRSRGEAEVGEEHPAIAAVRSLLKQSPQRALWGRIVEAVGSAPDLARMRSVYLEWIGRDYKPQNLTWLFDWYVNGVPEKGARNGNQRQQTAGERDFENRRQSEILLSRPKRSES